MQDLIVKIKQVQGLKELSDDTSGCGSGALPLGYSKMRGYTYEELKTLPLDNIFQKGELVKIERDDNFIYYMETKENENLLLSKDFNKNQLHALNEGKRPVIMLGKQIIMANSDVIYDMGGGMGFLLDCILGVNDNEWFNTDESKFLTINCDIEDITDQNERFGIEFNENVVFKKVRLKEALIEKEVLEDRNIYKIDLEVYLDAFISAYIEQIPEAQDDILASKEGFRKEFQKNSLYQPDTRTLDYKLYRQMKNGELIGDAHIKLTDFRHSTLGGNSYDYTNYKFYQGENIYVADEVPKVAIPAGWTKTGDYTQEELLTLPKDNILGNCELFKACWNEDKKKIYYLVFKEYENARRDYFGEEALKDRFTDTNYQGDLHMAGDLLVVDTADKIVPNIFNQVWNEGFPIFIKTYTQGWYGDIKTFSGYYVNEEVTTITNKHQSNKVQPCSLLTIKPEYMETIAKDDRTLYIVNWDSIISHPSLSDMKQEFENKELAIHVTEETAVGRLISLGGFKSNYMNIVFE